MIVISESAIADIEESDGWMGPDKVYAVFSFESPTGRKVWEVCFSWEEADKVALKGSATKAWEREGNPTAALKRALQEPSPMGVGIGLEDVEEDLKGAYDREWKAFNKSGILEGKGQNRNLYGWSFLRPQVQAWSVMLEKKMRAAADKLQRLNEVDVEVLMAWIEADMEALKEAFDDNSEKDLATRAMDVSLNCVLLTDRMMKIVLEDPDGDSRER